MTEQVFMLRKIQDEILTLVDNTEEPQVRTIVAELDCTYPPKEVRRAFRILLDSGPLVFGDKLELRREPVKD